MRPSGRAIAAMRPVSSRAGGRQIRRGLVPGAVRRHPCAVHRLGRGAGAAVSAQHRARLGHRRIRHAAALDPYPHRPRGGARPAERPHPGDPAPDRPQPARRHRPRRARRAPDPHRLRRHPGRWRHPHRGDHRQLCRALPGAGQTRAPAGLLPKMPLNDSVAAISCGVFDGRRRARPRLCRGFAGRDRRQFRADRRRAASSRSRRPPRGRRSTRPALARCWRWPALGIAELTAAQRAALGLA